MWASTSRFWVVKLSSPDHGNNSKQFIKFNLKHFRPCTPQSYVVSPAPESIWNHVQPKLYVYDIWYTKCSKEEDQLPESDSCCGICSCCAWGILLDLAIFSWIQIVCLHFVNWKAWHMTMILRLRGSEPGSHTVCLVFLRALTLRTNRYLRWGIDFMCFCDSELGIWFYDFPFSLHVGSESIILVLNVWWRLRGRYTPATCKPILSPYAFSYSCKLLNIYGTMRVSLRSTIHWSNFRTTKEIVLNNFFLIVKLCVKILVGGTSKFTFGGQFINMYIGELCVI